MMNVRRAQARALGLISRGSVVTRSVGLVAFLLTAVGSVAAGPGRAAPAAEVDVSRATIEVAVRQGLLSVNLRDAPLADVLQAIGEQAGFRVIIKGDLSAPVTWSFTQAPVDKALRRLLQNTSSVLIYAPSRDGGIGPLVEVIVLETKADAAARTAQIARMIPAKRTGGSRKTAVVSLNDDREDRLRAVQRLANKPDAAATKDLALLLSEDEDPMIRRIAAIALGKIGGARAEAALTGALEDEDSLVRGRAIQALARKWGHKAVGSLGKTLMKDPDPTVRRQAALSLGRMSGEEALEALQAAQGDADYAVRRAVAFALARLGDL